MISEKKLKAFALGEMGRRGVTRKEVQEAKMREEKEAVGKAYQEFVDTFEGSTPLGKTWVKAGTFDAGRRTEDTTDKGTIYKPKSKLLEPKAPSSPSTTTATSGGNKNKRPEKPGKKKQQEKKKSNLEMFKEELKAIQSEREERHRVKNIVRSGSSTVNSSSSATGPSLTANSSALLPSSKELGSHDNGDPNTTNLYLGNLSPRLTEQQLLEIFGKYGPLASIKIMWPRTEDEKSRGRNCGFVAYMSRKDGDRAMANLLGKDIDGFEMKMGWGKPVPIPLHPIYVPPKLLKYTLPPPQTNLPFNCQPDPKDMEKLKGKIPPETEEEKELFNKMIYRSKVKVVIPTDRTQLCLINRLIEFVIREGPMFEAMIMNREMVNPNFRFLFENKSPEHIYYRWRLYSLLQGDTKDNWNTNEFRMFKGGSLWKPPPVNLYTAGMPDELVEDGSTEAASESNKRGKKEIATEEDEEAAKNNRRGLSESQRDRFEEMLRGLVMDRNPIAEAMVWCIEHADAGQEIVECIAESLSILQTPIVKKIARLYLISDILHNCSAKGIPNVSYYRKGFQAKLPEIFGDLRDFHKNIDSRIKAEAFKQRVMLCFRAWEDWALYPQEFLIKLQNTFLGLTMSRDNDDTGNDVTPTQPVGSASDEDDVDGIPLDGAALLKSAAKTGAEGFSRTTNKDTDDSDIDGAPIEGAPKTQKRSQSTPSAPGFVPSKWETVDPEDVQAQAVTSKWDIFDEYDKEKSRSRYNRDEDDIDGIPLRDEDEDDGGHDFRVSEARRAKLREIELKVMCFQDELESGKRPSKHGWTISEQVEHYRKKIMKRELRSDGGGPSSVVDSDDDRPSRSSKRKSSRKKSGRSSSSSRSRSRSKERSKRRRRRSSSSNESPHSRSRRSRSRSSRRSSKRSRSRSPKKHKKKRH